ncbi:MAG TPA: hypothetical protein DCZ13_11920 [Porticoccaceae bacterium]|nr:hypothetical protein [Porticoccaceae bacterium]
MSTNDSRAKEFVGIAKRLFDGRQPVLSLWQTMAENFYPVMADFTHTRNIGDEFVEDLMSSSPVAMHRELSGVIGVLLRQGQWFRLGAGDSVGNRGQRVLESMTKIQRDKMYKFNSGFVRSATESDEFVTAFGQSVRSVELRPDRSGLLVRSWHLRDVAWNEMEDRTVGMVVRKWRPEASSLVSMFPKTVSSRVKTLAEKSPFERVDCLHILSPVQYRNTTEFDPYPYTSTYVEVADCNVLEDIGLYNKYYVIPRWKTIPHTPYAHSPATAIALPDARLLQAVTMTLLEAGEKFTNPPLLIQEGMLRGDAQLFAGGQTWVNPDYDEKMGEVLRPVKQNASGMPIGFNMAESITAQLADAMYINKLTLPDLREMTAFEASHRIQEMIRHQLPLLSPLIEEDNRQMCEVVFDLLLRNGDFGAPLDLLREVGEELEFEFESPIKKYDGKEKQGEFLGMLDSLAAALEIDPSVRHDVDISQAFREVVDGMGYSPTWMRPEDEAQQARVTEQLVAAAAGAA